jgi:hypothetical protein
LFSVLSPVNVMTATLSRDPVFELQSSRDDRRNWVRVPVYRTTHIDQRRHSGGSNHRHETSRAPVACDGVVVTKPDAHRGRTTLDSTVSEASRPSS